MARGLGEGTRVILYLIAAIWAARVFMRAFNRVSGGAQLSLLDYASVAALAIGPMICVGLIDWLLGLRKR